MGLLPSRAPKRRMALRRMPLTSTAVLALLELYLLAPLSGLAAGEKLFLELNSAEAVENRCRLNFVVQNKSDSALESMKLDLVVFDTWGAIRQRMLTEMGPVRPLKTSVRTFVLDMDCAQIGSILMNDVAACAPASPNECLDGLLLASRLKEVRF